MKRAREPKKSKIPIRLPSKSPAKEAELQEKKSSRPVLAKGRKEAAPKSAIVKKKPVKEAISHQGAAVTSKSTKDQSVKPKRQKAIKKDVDIVSTERESKKTEPSKPAIEGKSYERDSAPKYEPRASALETKTEIGAFKEEVLHSEAKLLTESPKPVMDIEPEAAADSQEKDPKPYPKKEREEPQALVKEEGREGSNTDIKEEPVKKTKQAKKIIKKKRALGSRRASTEAPPARKSSVEAVIITNKELNRISSSEKQENDALVELERVASLGDAVEQQSPSKLEEEAEKETSPKESTKVSTRKKRKKKVKVDENTPQTSEEVPIPAEEIRKTSEESPVPAEEVIVDPGKEELQDDQAVGKEDDESLPLEQPKLAEDEGGEDLAAAELRTLAKLMETIKQRKKAKQAKDMSDALEMLVSQMLQEESDQASIEDEAMPEPEEPQRQEVSEDILGEEVAASESSDQEDSERHEELEKASLDEQSEAEDLQESLSESQDEDIDAATESGESDEDEVLAEEAEEGASEELTDDGQEEEEIAVAILDEANEEMAHDEHLENEEEDETIEEEETVDEEEVEELDDLEEEEEKEGKGELVKEDFEEEQEPLEEEEENLGEQEELIDEQEELVEEVLEEEFEDEDEEEEEEELGEEDLEEEEDDQIGDAEVLEEEESMEAEELREEGDLVETEVVKKEEEPEDNDDDELVEEEGLEELHEKQELMKEEETLMDKEKLAENSDLKEDHLEKEITVDSVKQDVNKIGNEVDAEPDVTLVELDQVKEEPLAGQGEALEEDTATGDETKEEDGDQDKTDENAEKEEDATNDKEAVEVPIEEDDTLKSGAVSNETVADVQDAAEGNTEEPNRDASAAEECKKDQNIVDLEAAVHKLVEEGQKSPMQSEEAQMQVEDQVAEAISESIFTKIVRALSRRSSLAPVESPISPTTADIAPERAAAMLVGTESPKDDSELVTSEHKATVEEPEPVVQEETESEVSNDVAEKPELSGNEEKQDDSVVIEEEAGGSEAVDLSPVNLLVSVHKLEEEPGQEVRPETESESQVSNSRADEVSEEMTVDDGEQQESMAPEKQAATYKEDTEEASEEQTASDEVLEPQDDLEQGLEAQDQDADRPQSEAGNFVQDKSQDDLEESFHPEDQDHDAQRPYSDADNLVQDLEVPKDQGLIEEDTGTADAEQCNTIDQLASTDTEGPQPDLHNISFELPPIEKPLHSVAELRKHYQPSSSNAQTEERSRDDSDKLDKLLGLMERLATTIEKQDAQPAFEVYQSCPDLSEGVLESVEIPIHKSSVDLSTLNASDEPQEASPAQEEASEPQPDVKSAEKLSREVEFALESILEMKTAMSKMMHLLENSGQSKDDDDDNDGDEGDEELASYEELTVSPPRSLAEENEEEPDLLRRSSVSSVSVRERVSAYETVAGKEKKEDEPSAPAGSLGLTTDRGQLQALKAKRDEFEALRAIFDSPGRCLDCGSTKVSDDVTQNSRHPPHRHGRQRPLLRPEEEEEAGDASEPAPEDEDSSGLVAISCSLCKRHAGSSPALDDRSATDSPEPEPKPTFAEVEIQTEEEEEEAAVRPLARSYSEVEIQTDEPLPEDEDNDDDDDDDDDDEDEDPLLEASGDFPLSERRHSESNLQLARRPLMTFSVSMDDLLTDEPTFTINVLADRINVSSSSRALAQSCIDFATTPDGGAKLVLKPSRDFVKAEERARDGDGDGDEEAPLQKIDEEEAAAEAKPAALSAGSECSSSGVFFDETSSVGTVVDARSGVERPPPPPPQQQQQQQQQQQLYYFPDEEQPSAAGLVLSSSGSHENILAGSSSSSSSCSSSASSSDPGSPLSPSLIELASLSSSAEHFYPLEPCKALLMAEAAAAAAADAAAPGSVSSASGESVMATQQVNSSAVGVTRLCKILFIGSSSTGKTSIIRRYVKNSFLPSYRATIGADFLAKVVHWDERITLRLQLWDIAGQDRFSLLSRSFYRDACGAFIVSDLSRPETLEAVIRWKEELDLKTQADTGQAIPCFLLANKCDLLDESNPQYKHHAKICQEYGFQGWKRTSAKNDINIREAINMLLQQIAAEMHSSTCGQESRKLDSESIVLHTEDGDDESISAKKKVKKQGSGCAC